MHDSTVAWMIDRERARHEDHAAIHLATLRAARLERTWGPGHLIERLRARAAATAAVGTPSASISPDCCAV